MKKSNSIYFILIILLLVIGCNNKKDKNPNTVKDKLSTSDSKDNSVIKLTLKEANTLAELPLACMQEEYPNKLGQTLGSEKDLAEPHKLHPAFYGCFDWHSAVHGHWSLVKLLKDFPKLEKADLIRSKLKESLTAQNIRTEVKYFEGEHNKSFERTYGWAWLLKLAEELYTWNAPLAKELSKNLKPLTDLIVKNYMDFLPKLNYPLRIGEHGNTAFGLAFAWDYANTTKHKNLKRAIELRAKEFYMNDSNCPLSWEPGGFDFLSPCLEEIDLMRRILNKEEFNNWLENFVPHIKSKDFELKVGEVSDRKDGHLVHLDGLNFSRAWVLYGLANQYAEYNHLIKIANEHVKYSLPNLVGDSYEGGHWLGSFAIYALDNSPKK
ncbi:MAG: hypothetical protein CR986_02700 [Ignavibacteriae bacterium]|nr:MAG: hypothetical protein CR986_02700 [Ignavibacteriota bacterium]